MFLVNRFKNAIGFREYWIVSNSTKYKQRVQSSTGSHPTKKQLEGNCRLVMLIQSMKAKGGIQVFVLG